jgi:hypothetical protein
VAREQNSSIKQKNKTRGARQMENPLQYSRLSNKNQESDARWKISVFSPDSCRPRVAAPPAVRGAAERPGALPHHSPRQRRRQGDGVTSKRPPKHLADASTTRFPSTWASTRRWCLPSEYENKGEPLNPDLAKPDEHQEYRWGLRTLFWKNSDHKAISRLA